MFRKIIIPALAIIGITFGLFMVYWGSREPEAPPILFDPPTPPYDYYVAGEGLIESLNESIEVGVPFPDLVWEHYAHVGDTVTKGMPLFKLDTRQQEANMIVALQELEEAKTRLQNATQQFSYFQRLSDKSAVSEQEYTRAHYTQQEATDAVHTAQARVDSIKTTIERAIIRSPIDGKVLQENVHIGEVANINPFDRERLMVIGSTGLVQIRINIAEENAWRVMPKAPGIAYVRGNTAINFPLQFRYIEPYIVEKQALSGLDSDLVDTRVLQIIYTFDPQNAPVYVGQLLDVYLKAKPSAYDADKSN